MNLPEDIHSALWVYTTFYKESISTIVLEFAMPASTDNPLHDEVIETEGCVYTYKATCLWDSESKNLRCVIGRLFFMKGYNSFQWWRALQSERHRKPPLGWLNMKHNFQHHSHVCAHMMSWAVKTSNPALFTAPLVWSTSYHAFQSHWVKAMFGREALINKIQIVSLPL